MPARGLGTIKKAALMGWGQQGFAPTPVGTQRFGSPASGGERNRNNVETFSRPALPVDFNTLVITV